MRVLVVEDEVIVAFHLEAVLLEEGHRVVGLARDARSAQILARDKNPDLALVDVMLTDGETGPEIARHLSEMGVPVLFLTATAERLPDGLAGALGVVAKPITEHVLKSAVRYAEAHRQGQPPEEPPPGLITRRTAKN